MLDRLRAGHMTVHIPPRRDLHTHRLKAKFHPTPEFFIQTGGASDFVCPGTVFRMEEGDACVIARGLPHAETPVDLKTRYGILVIGDMRGQPYILRGRSDDTVHIHSCDVHVFSDDSSREAMNHLDAISEHISIAPQHRDAYVAALLEAFVLRMCAILGHRQEERPPSTVPSLIQEVRKYVRVHLNDSRLSVTAIARSLACTPDHISRQFHRFQGLTLTTWITQERVAMAQHLLEESTHNVSEVGWACGFNEPSYFIRTFKQYTGVTPRVYREQSQQPDGRERFSGELSRTKLAAN